MEKPWETDARDGEGADDGMVCLACGGPVDSDGHYAAGGEVRETLGDGPGGVDSSKGPMHDPMHHHDAGSDDFARALLKRAIRGL